MKKISDITNGISFLRTIVLINDVALVESISKKSGLYNVKTNDLIGALDDYKTIYDKNNMIYVQIKKKEETEDKCDVSYLRIYDAKENVMIANNYILDKSFELDYQFCSLITKDGKKYLFNNKLFRNKEIQSSCYDDIEILYRNRDDTYLIVSLNGKKGIYSKNLGRITELVYDDIECIDGVIIFTQGKSKGFASANNYQDVKINFDDIKVEDSFIYAGKIR